MTRRMRWLAGLVALGLLASACGGDDDGGDAEADGGTTETTEAPADGGEAEDGAAADDGATETTAAPEGEPVVGGEVTMLLEAETNTWDIPGANCAVSCITVMRQVAEPLFIEDEDGVPQPYLLSSAESNSDFTEWTLTMRDGITFHDGTPADGAAVKTNIEAMKAGPLQGQVLADLTSVELVDPMTVKVVFSAPTSNFPAFMAERTGYLLAPAFWADPNLRATQPIGTGPFQWESWVPDQELVLVKNENYWRTDDEGRELPFLDRITFRPIPDSATRRATMESGDADINHDTFAENREFWTTDWEGELMPDPANVETTYLLINNATAPFDNVDARRAIALCTDREEYVAFRSPGNTIANGPFAEGTGGYLEDTGFPEFDPEAGRALAEEIGLTTVEYGTTNDRSNQITAELFADMWNRNCGIEVTIDIFDQSELITRALTGDFQMFLWRNHSEVSVGNEFVWWHSRHASGLALNFGRFQDPDIDAALEGIRATDDRAEQDALAQEINRAFGENVYNLWLTYTQWSMPYRTGVNGVGKVSLPDGGYATPTRAGRLWLHEVWVEG